MFDAELYTANISELHPVALLIRAFDDLIFDDKVVLLTFWAFEFGDIFL